VGRIGDRVLLSFRPTGFRAMVVESEDLFRCTTRDGMSIERPASKYPSFFDELARGVYGEAVLWRPVRLASGEKDDALSFSVRLLRAFAAALTDRGRGVEDG